MLIPIYFLRINTNTTDSPFKRISITIFHSVRKKEFLQIVILWNTRKNALESTRKYFFFSNKFNLFILTFNIERSTFFLRKKQSLHLIKQRQKAKQRKKRKVFDYLNFNLKLKSWNEMPFLCVEEEKKIHLNSS